MLVAASVPSIEQIQVAFPDYSKAFDEAQPVLLARSCVGIPVLTKATPDGFDPYKLFLVVSSGRHYHGFGLHIVLNEINLDSE